MTFLALGQAIVAGAFAVPALLALYLLKLRRRPVRVGSTMLWDEAASDLEANTPLRWLRASWLLALHLLILLLLLIALARPAIDGDPATGGRLFIAIDQS
ncbi:MAG: BatA domain-containing protein, partial [Planctomycetota bacterium]